MTYAALEDYDLDDYCQNKQCFLIKILTFDQKLETLIFLGIPDGQRLAAAEALHFWFNSSCQSY